jgi:hypothetical protein
LCRKNVSNLWCSQKKETPDHATTSSSSYAQVEQGWDQNPALSSGKSTA